MPYKNLKDQYKNMKKYRKNNPLFLTWTSMKNRCYNINNSGYKNYGGRGIKMSTRWYVYKTFENDMLPTYKKGLTLNRINNDGNYSKENCRWATSKEQSRNKSVTILYKGECAKDASIRLGGDPKLVSGRIKRLKWTYKKAFTTKPYGK